MYSKKLKLTVGITALNEEGNIKNLLKGILSQSSNHYSLFEIILISDGSSDRTAKVAGSVKSSKIKVYEFKENKGKYYRLNQIFKYSKGEALVLLDADIQLTSSRILDELVKSFDDDKRIGMVCGRAQPLAGKTFIENCVNTSFEAYDKLRIKYKNGNNAYSVEGRILLLSPSIFKKLVLPKTLADDSYIYFYCLKKELIFKFNPKATVFYKSPNNINDQIKQNARFQAREMILKSYFGGLVSKEYQLPRNLKYINLANSFIKHPVYSISILLINLYSKYFSSAVAGNETIWSPVKSTKAII